MDDVQGGGRISGEEIRGANFPSARRGYDPEAVRLFLDRVAGWVESKAGDAGEAGGDLASEFAKVGERTAGILTAAEEAASKLRREAKEQAERLRSEAQQHSERLRSEAKEYADKLRASAEEDARKAKLGASQKADELIAAAETKSDRMIEESVARRRRLNEAVSSLIKRRDEIAGEARRLAGELLEMVDSLRAEEPSDEIDEAPDTAAAGSSRPPEYELEGSRERYERR